MQILDTVKVVGVCFVIVWLTAGCGTKCPHGDNKVDLELEVETT